MLSFFRRIINSKAGLIVTFVVLGVIALAFAAGDVTGLRSSGMSLAGNKVATVGGTPISAADFTGRVQNTLEGVRQQQPTITMDQLVAQGGLEAVLDRMINNIAFDEFGRDEGMVVSKRLVDGQIASIPALQGATGQFDPQAYQRLLIERKLTDAQVRSDFARDIMAQQLILPTIGAGQVPVQLALPYAALLLEKRSGQLATIPTAAMGSGTPPTDAELQAFYTRNRGRYTVPERRIVRYALVTAASVKDKAVPTDAEIAQAYAKDRAKYAPTEKRTVTQVVVADQAGANALAAKVKGGESIAAAARAAGLEPSTRTAVDKAAYAGTSSASVADAVFAAGRGATVGPVRGPLGWIVAHVDSIEQVAGKTVEQARPEIVEALTKQKTQVALGEVHDALDDALSNNATFDEAVADRKLSPQTTAPLLANGTDPDQPQAKPDAALAPLLTAAFQAQEGDSPQLVPTGTDGSFALVSVGRVVGAAPRPLAQIRPQVAADFAADRARAAARTLANDILAKVTKGMPLAQAIAAAGRPLPPVKPLTDLTRRDIAADGQRPDAALAMLFNMAPGSAKLIEAPDRSGWGIVTLGKVVPGNAANQPAIVAGTRQQIGRVVGREYAEQFTRAIRAQVGVKTDAAALARIRGELTGAAGGAN